MRSETSAWIQYEFDEPFLCQSIHIERDGNNYQANRLRVQASDDGRTYRDVAQLEPPRHGWQDTDVEVTHAVPPTKARYFRFLFDKSGSEPGAEDLDAAKWRPILKVRHIQLSSEPRLHQFEGKTARAWRVSRRTTTAEIPDEACVSLKSMIDLSNQVDANGRLRWDAPPGKWTVLRLGHTSTGHENATGGGGRGLECDKFNRHAVRMQFDHWFGAVRKQVGAERAQRVLKVLHVDSWECGSQNWTKNFPAEFQQRRGYDLRPYLPALAGIPVETADVSERFLHDFRQTIAELLVEAFYDTLAELALDHECQFSAECIAPTMAGDGMLPFRAVDIPMGEFWLDSPTHDKPNDILDAVSAAHIYGKRMVQAEAFTQLRMEWNEHPGMLKSLGDRHFCLGINRLVPHVFVHNPWLDRQPGMTLDGIGIYFQRDQTWWSPGKAWLDYLSRCQFLLQQGRPVADVAVFTGEETPRRAVLPHRLIGTLPGPIGSSAVERERRRLANRGAPQCESPPGVWHSANMIDPANWLDPLRGYQYDSINRDALLRLATVEQGDVCLPGGARYAVLVIPGPRPLSPHAELMTPEVAARLLELRQAGATIVMAQAAIRSPGLQDFPAADHRLKSIVAALDGEPCVSDGPAFHAHRGGRCIAGPIEQASLRALGIEPDLQAADMEGRPMADIAWTHRALDDGHVYFISNQSPAPRQLNVVCRASGLVPELWDAVTGEITPAAGWGAVAGGIGGNLSLAANGSLFVVLRRPESVPGRPRALSVPLEVARPLSGPWTIAFGPSEQAASEPLHREELVDWTSLADPSLRYFSGTAVYECEFDFQRPATPAPRYWLDLGRVANLAEVTLNGQPCGVAWTAPFRLEITSALQPGANRLNIAVTNTWANRLLGDAARPERTRSTWTNAPSRWDDRDLEPAGLMGPVVILQARTRSAEPWVK